MVCLIVICDTRLQSATLMPKRESYPARSEARTLEGDSNDTFCNDTRVTHKTFPTTTMQNILWV